MYQSGQQEYPYTTYGPCYYSRESNPSLVITEKKRKFNFCSCCAVIVFTILLIIVVASILAFLLNGTHWFIGGLEKLGFTSTVTTSNNTHVSRVERLAGYLANKCLTPESGREAAKLITIDEFEELKKNSKICLFDTVSASRNGSQMYLDGHIAGSRWFNVSEVVFESKFIRRELHHPLVFENYAQQNGIDQDCLVVLYDQSDYAKSLLDATYTWWLFKVFGYNSVAVLNGGQRAYENRFPEAIVEGPESDIERGNFIAGWERAYFRDYDDVIRNFENLEYHFIDAREKNDFDGIRKAVSKANGKGRILGALNVPSNEILTNEGALKSEQQLKILFDNKGIVFTKKYIVYCNIGYQASAVFFALKRLGYQVTIYPAGWVEFSNRAPAQFIWRPE